MTPIEQQHLTDVQRDRAVGVLVGTATGDALGAGYEFTHPGAGTPIVMKGGGTFDWAPGEWTDDTSMALCVAEGLSSGRVDLDSIAAAFMRWYRSNPPDIGNQTRAVLSARPAGGAAMAHAAARVPGRTGGNGSLMRTAPVALAFLDDLGGAVEAAGAISDLTHCDVRAREACRIWSAGIHHAVLTGSPVGVREFVDAAPASTREYWSPLLDLAETGSPADFPDNGWVVHALQTAWWAITAGSGDLAQTLELCVRAGNDTDTTAAIAGGLIGASCGASAVPRDWFAMLHGYPGATATDLEELTDRLINRATPQEATA